MAVSKSFSFGASKNRIVNKVHAMGDEYFLLHSEIHPFGNGTRRYVLGRHIEKPVFSHITPKGNKQMTPGKQEYLSEPMDGIDFKPWLEQFIIDNKDIGARGAIKVKT